MLYNKVGKIAFTWSTLASQDDISCKTGPFISIRSKTFLAKFRICVSIRSQFKYKLNITELHNYSKPSLQPCYKSSEVTVSKL